MVSYARLAEMLDGLFGLKISKGAIANMLGTRRRAVCRVRDKQSMIMRPCATAP
jgi:hypothetical protein